MFDKPKYKVTVSSKTEFDENFKKKFENVHKFQNAGIKVSIVNYNK